MFVNASLRGDGGSAASGGSAVPRDDRFFSLSRGMTGLLVRLARAFNRALGRRGRVWSGRFHSRALGTPREVRNGLVYVLMNHRKHAPTGSTRTMHGFDVRSSAPWFDGWAHAPPLVPPPPRPSEDPPVCPPQTWLARLGWKRLGLIQIDESPRRRGGSAMNATASSEGSRRARATTCRSPPCERSSACSLRAARRPRSAASSSPKAERGTTPTNP